MHLKWMDAYCMHAPHWRSCQRITRLSMKKASRRQAWYKASPFIQPHIAAASRDTGGPEGHEAILHVYLITLNTGAAAWAA